MNRWKRERGFTSIRMMHAHHQYSRWHFAVLEAAERLGLTVLYREWANHSDGSLDRGWQVSTSHLERVGGLAALHGKAEEIHKERMAG